MSKETQQTRADGELSKELLNEIVGSVTEGMVAIDAEGRYVYVNDEAARLLETAPCELNGKIAWETFPNLVGAQAQCVLREAASQRAVREFESHNAKLDRWFETKAFPT